MSKKKTKSAGQVYSRRSFHGYVRSDNSNNTVTPTFSKESNDATYAATNVMFGLIREKPEAVSTLIEWSNGALAGDKVSLYNLWALFSRLTQSDERLDVALKQYWKEADLPLMELVQAIILEISDPWSPIRGDDVSKWERVLAWLGNRDLSFEYGNYYRNGNGPVPRDYRMAVLMYLNSISSKADYSKISPSIDSIYNSVRAFKNGGKLNKTSVDIARALEESGKADLHDIIRFYELAISPKNTETAKELGRLIQNRGCYREVNVPLVTGLMGAMKRGDKKATKMYHSLLKHIRTEQYIRPSDSSSANATDTLDVVAGVFPDIVGKTNKDIRSRCKSCFKTLIHHPHDAYDSLCGLGGSPDRLKQLLEEGEDQPTLLYALSEELSDNCPYMSLILETEAAIEGSSEATAACVERIDVNRIYSIGFTKDILQKAVDIGNLNAILKLTDLLERFPGLGSEEDEMHLLEMASEMGDADSTMRLAKRVVSEDNGLERYIELMSRAAGLGNIEAMMTLGAYYVDEDENKESAIRWYTMAAESGNPAAMYKLGKLLKWNDDEKAMYWLEQALENGEENAAYDLYLLHRGTKSYDSQAEVYLRKAYYADDPRAIKEMQRRRESAMAMASSLTETKFRFSKPICDDSGKYINRDDTRA